MSIFNPEKLVHNLIASLGVKPEEFVAFIQLARDEFIGIRNDRQAFRPASAKAYQDVVARLDRIEAKINLLLMRQDSSEFRDKHPAAIDIDGDHIHVRTDLISSD